MGYFQDGRKAEGTFQLRENKRWFEFRGTTNWWAMAQGLDYEVAVGGIDWREIRFAKILKTVAYIAVDEDANGDAVLEKWYITNHKVF